jgi:hypothetical protein
MVQFALISLVVLLVGYGYSYQQQQTAYGVTIPANGIMNVPGMPGTTIRAPPGSSVSNLTITHYGPSGSIIKTNPITTTTPTTTTAIFQPFMNLTNGTYTLYNETSGSTSLMRFNRDGTYDRILHGNDWRGIWHASIITEKMLQMCSTSTEPDGDHCDLIGLEPDTPNSIGFLDSLVHTMHLIHNGYSVPPPQISTLNRTSVRAALLPFTNLAKGTWTLYNESDGTTSLLQFNRNGTYSELPSYDIYNNKDNDENGNSNSAGIWNTSIITKEVLQICPTEPKLMSGCMLIGLKPNPYTPSTVQYMDDHGGTMSLIHNNDGVPATTIEAEGGQGG